MVLTNRVTVSLLLLVCWTILGTSVDQSWFQSDHLERDVTTLGLEETKLSQIHSILTHPLLQNDTLLQLANNTGMSVTPHLIYRYLESVEWSDKYHGKPVVEAIVETIEWRHSFGITHVDTTTIVPLIRKGLGYPSVYDKDGRVILYLKIGRNDEMQSVDVYHTHMMYMVERADRQCIHGGSGQFIALLDLTGLSWKTCPPMGMLKDAISILKKHYPYRLGGIFIVNAPSLFNWIWNLLKPFMPARALKKTFVLGKQDAWKVMNEKIGKEHLEASYGGTLPDVTTINDVDAFLSEGYWEKYHREMQRGVQGEVSKEEIGQCEVDDRGECIVLQGE